MGRDVTLAGIGYLGGKLLGLQSPDNEAKMLTDLAYLLRVKPASHVVGLRDETEAVRTDLYDVEGYSTDIGGVPLLDTDKIFYDEYDKERNALVNNDMFFQAAGGVPINFYNGISGSTFWNVMSASKPWVPEALCYEGKKYFALHGLIDTATVTPVYAEHGDFDNNDVIDQLTAPVSWDWITETFQYARDTLPPLQSEGITPSCGNSFGNSFYLPAVRRNRLGEIVDQKFSGITREDFESGYLLDHYVLDQFAQQD